MKIYIDFDDVICETAKYIARLAKDLFGTDLPYNEIRFFDLQKAYALSDAQYDRLMLECHTPESLLAYKETPYASSVINKWIRDGHDVSVITGRPFSSYEPSRMWLDHHGLERAPLFTVDKYGREKIFQAASHNMTLEQLYSMNFDFAVEDSPAAFDHLLHFENCWVAVFDRPWNRQEKLPGQQFARCRGWLEIDKMLKALQEQKTV